MERSANEPIEISIVLPCYDEEGSVEALTAELYEVLGRTGRRFEVLFVDDASRDHTPEILRDLRDKYRDLRVIRHLRNSGESAAQATGFRHARGAIVITLDSDGQNDPADVPRLLAALEREAEVAAVCGVRTIRRDDWLKRISSRIGNGFRRAVTGDCIMDAGCTYRALRLSALRELPVFNGMHRFLPTLLRMQGHRVVEIPVHHRPRSSGRSKYGIGNRMWRGIGDCLGVRWLRQRAVHGERALPEERS
jgi:glycosyltransferase involved in cell wall biosynthesis